MTKENIIDLFFKILNEQDEFILNVSKNNSNNNLVIQAPTGECFLVQIDLLEDSEDIMELRACKNLFAIYAEITLMEMRRCGFISNDEYREIWSRVSEGTALI